MQFLYAIALFFALAYQYGWTTACLAPAAYVAFLAYRLFHFSILMQKLKCPIDGPYLFPPFSNVLSFLLPPPFAPAKHRSVDPMRERKTKWEVYNSTIYATVGILPNRAHIVIGDVTTMQHIFADRITFPKALELYSMVKSFGESVLISEGDEWRKHRRIVGGAFSNSTNELDWQETMRYTKAWMAHLEKIAIDGVTVEEDSKRLCLHLALAVISSVAFGVPIAGPGMPEDPAPDGLLYNFRHTMEGALSSLFLNVILPRFTYSLPIKAIQKARMFDTQQRLWMKRIYNDRVKAIAAGEERKDVLSELVKANVALQGDSKSTQIRSDSSLSLTDSEVEGNMWIFLLAGHETTAHTLTFMLGLLAIYPEVQEWLFEELLELLPDPQTDLPFATFPLFTRSTAIMNETLRLWPAAPAIPKQVTTERDVIVPCTERGPGGQRQILLPKNSILNLNVQAVLHDPFYWKDPERFDPTRFIDTDDYNWNRDAFAPFSAGARSCIGTKFAQVEIVCFLSYLCRSYRIELPADQLRTGESQEQAAQRILTAKQGITVTPVNRIPLRFVLR